MKRFTYTLLAISTILIGSTSVVLAQSDTGNVQDATQTGVITGNGNRTYQGADQRNTGNRVNAPGTDVNVQRVDQLCDTAGDGNDCVQEGRQENTNNRVNTRPARPSEVNINNR